MLTGDLGRFFLRNFWLRKIVLKFWKWMAYAWFDCKGTVLLQSPNPPSETAYCGQLQASEGEAWSAAWRQRSHRREPREGWLWQSPKISIILDNNRNPWNLCIQNRNIPFWSCLSPPDTLSLPASSFTYWHNKIPGLSKNISGINKPCAHSVSGVPRGSRVSGVSISLLDQKIARFWSKSEQNRCYMCSAPNRNS